MATLKEASDGLLSHDELMLKELERRDGIYSFIFHELETPKGPGVVKPLKGMAAVGPVGPSSGSGKHALVSAVDFLPTHTSGNLAPAVGATPCASPAPTLAAATPRTIPHAAASSATTARHYHEYLRAWQPPTTLVYDHPRLYAYMANCGFRVRVPTPRFSHVTAPLVRNRRHALKDSPEYRRCAVCTVKVPDLRALFPHDPDVHAPFVGAAAATASAARAENSRALQLRHAKEAGAGLLK